MAEPATTTAAERTAPTEAVDAVEAVDAADAPVVVAERDDLVVVLEPGRKPFGVAADRVVAAALLLATAPLSLLVSAAVRLGDGGPVLFRQEREGIDGSTFTVLKFRTMRPDNDDRAHRALVAQEYVAPHLAAGTTDGIYKLEADPRVTFVGRWLRRSSIDELPQLLNVVRGEMSLVGPRPLPTYETELFSRQHRQRNRVRPGLTGLWQVSGRNRLTTHEMLDLDLEYVQRRSWRLDLAVLARTPAAVLRGDGAR